MLSKNKINVDKIKVIPFFSDKLKKNRAFDDHDISKESKCQISFILVTEKNIKIT